MNDEELTRFIALKPERLQIYENMVDRLCSKTHIDRELLRRYTQQCLTDWEVIEEQHVEDLFDMQPILKEEELNKILDLLTVYIDPVCPDRRRMNESINLALKFYKQMFEMM
jgi:hypothetical protein